MGDGLINGHPHVEMGKTGNSGFAYAWVRMRVNRGNRETQKRGAMRACGGTGVEVG
jgi:hypothetical protein